MNLLRKILNLKSSFNLNRLGSFANVFSRDIKAELKTLHPLEVVFIKKLNLKKKIE